MCGRFYVDPDEEEAQLLIKNAKKKPRFEQLQFKGGEVFPGSIVPVKTKDGPEYMLWGFPTLFPQGRPHINARSESAEKLKTFSKAYRHSRCLIPASAYFEWLKTDTQKLKYRFYLQDRRLFYLAGIFSDDQFAILTKAASTNLQHIHDRMPVVLPPHLQEPWLKNSDDCSAAIEDFCFDIA